jgi:hypothetical protein
LSAPPPIRGFAHSLGYRQRWPDVTAKAVERNGDVLPRKISLDGSPDIVKLLGVIFLDLAASGDVDGVDAVMRVSYLGRWRS